MIKKNFKTLSFESFFDAATLRKYLTQIKISKKIDKNFYYACFNIVQV